MILEDAWEITVQFSKCLNKQFSNFAGSTSTEHARKRKRIRHGLRNLIFSQNLEFSVEKRHFQRQIKEVQKDYIFVSLIFLLDQIKT